MINMAVVSCIQNIIIRKRRVELDILFFLLFHFKKKIRGEFLFYSMGYVMYQTVPLFDVITDLSLIFTYFPLFPLLNDALHNCKASKSVI